MRENDRTKLCTKNYLLKIPQHIHARMTAFAILSLFLQIFLNKQSLLKLLNRDLPLSAISFQKQRANNIYKIVKPISYHLKNGIPQRKNMKICPMVNTII